MFTGIVKSVGSVKTLEEDHLLISTDDDNFYNLETGTSISTVSYTHLTLPTIYSV